MATRYEFTADGPRPVLPPVHRRRPQAQPASEIPGTEVTGIGLGEQIRRFLEGQGVDVAQAVADAGHARERQAQRARDRVRAAGDLAFQLRRAKRELIFEQRGWRAGAVGFDLARVTEARQKVAGLDEMLHEACVGDPEIISEAKRRAGW